MGEIKKQAEYCADELLEFVQWIACEPACMDHIDMTKKARKLILGEDWKSDVCEDDQHRAEKWREAGV